MHGSWRRPGPRRKGVAGTLRLSQPTHPLCPWLCLTNSVRQQRHHRCCSHRPPLTAQAHLRRALAGGKPIYHATASAKVCGAGDRAACGALAALLASTCEAVHLELGGPDGAAEPALRAALPGTLTPLLGRLGLCGPDFGFLQDPSLAFPMLTSLWCTSALPTLLALRTLQVGAGAAGGRSGLNSRLAPRPLPHGLRPVTP
jgi:hypothetical protein